MARRDDKIQAEKFVFAKDHDALTSTTTLKVYKVPTGRTLRIDRISYINPTGLVGDPTNAFSLAVKNGSTQISLVFNTDTDDATPGASLAADTFVEATLSATDSERVLAAGDILSAVFTEDGTATLPAGTLIIEGRLF